MVDTSTAKRVSGKEVKTDSDVSLGWVWRCPDQGMQQGNWYLICVFVIQLLNIWEHPKEFENQYKLEDN